MPATVLVVPHCTVVSADYPYTVGAVGALCRTLGRLFSLRALASSGLNSSVDALPLLPPPPPPPPPPTEAASQQSHGLFFFYSQSLSLIPSLHVHCALHQHTARHFAPVAPAAAAAAAVAVNAEQASCRTKTVVFFHTTAVQSAVKSVQETTISPLLGH